MPNEDTLDSPSSPSPVEATDAEPSPPQYRVTLEDQPKPPLLNRAQRRQLRKYIRHKAALQMCQIFAKSARKSWMDMARQSNRCHRCGLWSIPAPAPYRCQCQVQQRRQCRMCGVDCMASA